MEIQPADPANPSPAPATPPPAPAAPAPAGPPAAEVVLKGDVTEETLKLRAKLTESEAALKQAQTDAAYNADEARRLKELQKPTPAPKKKGWFKTLLHEVED